MEVALIWIEDTCVCFVTISPLKIRHPSAGLKLLAASRLQEGEVIESYYGRLVFLDLSSEKHARKV